MASSGQRNDSARLPGPSFGARSPKSTFSRDAAISQHSQSARRAIGAYAASTASWKAKVTSTRKGRPSAGKHYDSLSLMVTAPDRLQHPVEFSTLDQHVEHHRSTSLPSPTKPAFKGHKTPRPQQPLSLHEDRNLSVFAGREQWGSESPVSEVASADAATVVKGGREPDAQAPVQRQATSSLGTSLSTRRTTECTQNSGQDDFYCTLPTLNPEGDFGTSTEVQTSPYQPPETLMHSSSPFEASFSLVNGIPAATAAVATPPLPQSMLPAATPRNSAAAAVSSCEGQLGAAFPSAFGQSDSKAHQCHSSNGPAETEAVEGMPESAAGTGGPESPGYLTSDLTPVALHDASTADSARRAPHSHSPVPRLKLPLRTKFTASTSSLPQHDSNNAHKSMDDSYPPLAPRFRCEEPAADGFSERATEAKHAAISSDELSLCDSRASEQQVHEPTAAPVGMGVISHCMSTPEPSNYPSSRSSPTVALITSSLSPQPQVKHVRQLQAAEGTDDCCVPGSVFNSTAQASVRDSGEVFDASAHAPGLGTGIDPPTTFKVRELDSSPHTCRVVGQANAPDECHGGNDEWPQMRPPHQERHAKEMGAEASSSNAHGAAFVRQELLRRSEEQKQREIDALFRGDIGDLLLPPLDSQHPEVAENMAPSSTGEDTGFVFDRKRTWTGVSSTLAGLAASDWSLEDATSMIDRRVTQTDDQESMPAVLEGERQLDQPAEIYRSDTCDSPRPRFDQDGPSMDMSNMRCSQESNIDSQHSNASELMDAIDGVEFSHVHHCPSMPGSSSDPPSAPPSISPTPPISTTNSSPTFPSCPLKNDAQKAVPTAYHNMATEDDPLLYTIPSADMTSAASWHQEQTRLEAVLDHDATGSSGTLTMQSGFGNTTYNNLERQTRERCNTVDDMAALHTVANHISFSQPYMTGKRSMGTLHHTPASNSLTRRDDHASTSQFTVPQRHSAHFLSRLGRTDEQNKLAQFLTTSGTHTMASTHDTATQDALQELLCTESRLEMVDSAGRDPIGSHVYTADTQCRPDVAVLGAGHHAEHEFSNVSYPQHARSQGTLELQEQTKSTHAAASGRVLQDGTHNTVASNMMGHDVPSAAAGIGLKGTSPEVQDILRSTRRHPSELNDARSGKSMALMTTEDMTLARGGELLNSQECNHFPAMDAVLKLRQHQSKLRSANDRIQSLQDTVHYLKREVASCNHERDLVDRLVTTRQELQAAQLHSKRTAAAGHAQAAQLFDWAWHLQKCLEAKQQESKATKTALSCLKAELGAVQTALVAAKQFEAATFSQRAPTPGSNTSASNPHSPRPHPIAAVPSELLSSPAFSARSAHTDVQQFGAAHPTSPSVAYSSFSAWTDGGALLDQPAMLELKRQRDAAIREACEARANLEQAKSAVALNESAASFYRVYAQDREALYEAQHKSYCELSDTFMGQVRADSAYASLSKQRRAQTAHLPASSWDSLGTRPIGRSAGQTMPARIRPRTGLTAWRSDRASLHDQAIWGLPSAREGIRGTRSHGKLLTSGDMAKGVAPGGPSKKGSYTLQYHRRRIMSPDRP